VLVEFRILGPIEVVSDGVPMDLGAPKQRAVLAVLLLHVNEVVPTERLVDLVWGKDPPRTADHSVQIYISGLRRAFGRRSGVIVTRRPGYELRIDPAGIDARTFEQLIRRAATALREGDRGSAASLAARALSMWRGPPLTDFAYDEFAQRETGRLNELRRRAVEILCEAYVFDGRPFDAVPLLRDAVTDHPIREEPHRLLALALYASGRHAEALRELRDYRRTLLDELGVDLSPDLLRLEEQILIRDPALSEAFGAASGGPVSRNPYKGLRAFGEADAGDFFGREGVVGRLLEACRQPLTAVVGPSGSGKSSVVRAGLIPRLRRGEVPGSEEWTIVTMLPGSDPFAEFEGAVVRATGGESGSCDPGDDASLGAAVRRIVGEEGTLFLVVDQFEELFVLTDEETRRAFLRNLSTAVADPQVRLKVLLTIRADFYGRPLLYPGFAGLFGGNVINLLPLTPSGIEAAAVEPARRVGAPFAPDLLAEIVADMADQPGALPLFQYVLTELFESRQTTAMTLDEYRRVGGIAGALGRRADAVFASLTPGEQDTARDVFLCLARPSGDRYTRRPVPILELGAPGGTESVSTVLARFGDERLLTFGCDSKTGVATVELSHEALLVHWRRLADWLEGARLDLARVESLVCAASEWEEAGRAAGYLLTDSRLADYQAWSRTTTVAIPRRAADYLSESITAARRAEIVEADRLDREARSARRARARLRCMLAAGSERQGDTFVTLTSIGDRPPTVVFLFSGPGDGDWNDQMLDGIERAAEDFDIDVGVRVSRVPGVGADLANIVASEPELVLDALSTEGAVEARQVMAAHPEIHFVLPDVGAFLRPDEIAAAANVSFPIFPVHEGSFLVGIVAGRMTGTRTVGFIGGVELPVVRRFEAGFVAGVEFASEFLDHEIDVLVDYLTPAWDPGGFRVPSIGMASAMKMHAAGADVVFSAAGLAGSGAREAALVTSEETGIHRWHIGVDQDEYAVAERDPRLHAALPHIATSMMKRIDVALYDALGDYHDGVFTPGLRRYGLEEGGVGYATTGGHIDHLIPMLEEVKERIINGEIRVPTEVRIDASDGRSVHPRTRG